MDLFFTGSLEEHVTFNQIRTGALTRPGQGLRAVQNAKESQNFGTDQGAGAQEDTRKGEDSGSG